MHAGALEFRPDAPAEEIAGAAKVIGENAHQALQDLQEVVGSCRPRSASCPSSPWPTPGGWWRSPARAGMRVDLHMDLRQETDEAVPDLGGRTALLGAHTSRSPMPSRSRAGGGRCARRRGA